MKFALIAGVCIITSAALAGARPAHAQEPTGDYSDALEGLRALDFSLLEAWAAAAAAQPPAPPPLAAVEAPAAAPAPAPAARPSRAVAGLPSTGARSESGRVRYPSLALALGAFGLALLAVSARTRPDTSAA